MHLQEVLLLFPSRTIIAAYRFRLFVGHYKGDNKYNRRIKYLYISSLDNVARAYTNQSSTLDMYNRSIRKTLDN